MSRNIKDGWMEEEALSGASECRPAFLVVVTTKGAYGLDDQAASKLRMNAEKARLKACST